MTRLLPIRRTLPVATATAGGAGTAPIGDAAGLPRPAHARGPAPAPTMRGGSDNYHSGAPIDGGFESVFPRPVMSSARDTSLRVAFVPQPL